MGDFFEFHQNSQGASRMLPCGQGKVCAYGAENPEARLCFRVTISVFVFLGDGFQTFFQVDLLDGGDDAGV